MKQVEHRREDCIELLARYNKRAAYVLMLKYFKHDVPTVERDFDE